MENSDKEFVELIIKAIVSDPDKVRVERTVDELGVLLTVHVNPNDIGYVIGRQGQTIRSVRTLAKIVGAKNNARVNIKLHEPDGGNRMREKRPYHRQVREELSTADVDNLKI